MTRTTKILLASGATVVVLAGLAGVGIARDRGWNCGPGSYGPAAFGPDGPMMGPMMGPMGGPMGGLMGGRIFERFDANGDGKLTQAEIDQVQAERLAAFDADGNGQLTLEEYEALWLATARPFMVDRFQAQDDDGDGVITAEEFAARPEAMLQQFDRNGDGKLTQAELRPDRRGWWNDGDDD